LIIYPAIDLRHGQCVRLVKGDPAAQTVYGTDPAFMARRWTEAGARWLHIVNLDGAFGDSEAAKANQAAIAEISRSIEIPFQLGGGLRSMEDIEQAFQLGARRVILGTAAIEQPELVQQAIAQFGPGQVVAGIDASDGYVAVRGWREVTKVTALELALQLKDWGIRTVIHTDISRDGMLEGANLAASARLSSESGLAVIISGGVSGMADIRAAVALQHPGLDGIIIGKALYAGDIDLAEALTYAAAEQRPSLSERES
jgi:phosphoribosylformimino-5-aminoimidazole carboxamide ribotide isomerase